LILIGEGIDVAIRVGKLMDSSLRAVRIGDFAEWLVASPSLIPGNMKLTSPAGLASLPFIALSVLPRPLSWNF
jgi:DNA-binding transcriptional LysR family regulator